MAATSGLGQPAAVGSGPKLVGVACSPRPGKTTRAAVQLALDAAKEAHPELRVELIDLAGAQDSRGAGSRPAARAGPDR
jgi:hypothetical protein